ncbi:MAG: hypothetical protein LQ338_008286, partial [Usnochroma carphineum]
PEVKKRYTEFTGGRHLTCLTIEDSTYDAQSTAKLVETTYADSEMTWDETGDADSEMSWGQATDDAYSDMYFDDIIDTMIGTLTGAEKMSETNTSDRDGIVWGEAYETVTEGGSDDEEHSLLPYERIITLDNGDADTVVSEENVEARASGAGNAATEDEAVEERHGGGNANAGAHENSDEASDDEFPKVEIEGNESSDGEFPKLEVPKPKKAPGQGSRARAQRRTDEFLRRWSTRSLAGLTPEQQDRYFIKHGRRWGLSAATLAASGVLQTGRRDAPGVQYRIQKLIHEGKNMKPRTEQNVWRMVEKHNRAQPGDRAWEAKMIQLDIMAGMSAQQIVDSGVVTMSTNTVKAVKHRWDTWIRRGEKLPPVH